MKDSSSVTFDQSSHVYANSISNIVSNDMRKIGYDTDPATALVSATQNSITFKGDIDNNGTVDDVTWKFDKTQPITSTSNPNDYTLTRTVDGVTTNMSLGVTKFNITLYDGQGNVVTNVSSAKRIKVELVCESPESMDGSYYPASWQKIFAPVSLN